MGLFTSNTYMLAKVARPATPSSVEESEMSDVPAPIADAPKITYNLTILSLDQAQKASRSHETVARFVVLPSDLEWEDVYTRLKIKICDVLFPGQAEVLDNAFEMLFSIPRHVPAPLPLQTEDDYNHLVKNVLKVRKDPLTKISVKQFKPVSH